MIAVFLSFLLSYAHASELNLFPKAYFDSEKGEMVYGKVIQIKDDKIIGILKRDQVKDVTELKDMYLLPGFIDCHTHLLLAQLKGETEFEDTLTREARLGPEKRIERAKGFLKDYLKAGFTSLCDLGNSGRFLDVQLRKQTESDKNFPHLYVSGPGIATNKGQFPAKAQMSDFNNEYSIVNAKTDVDKLLQGYLDQKVDILKIYLDNNPGAGSMDEALLKKILSNSKSKKFKKITYHASELKSFELAEKLGIQSLEHANQITLTKKKSSLRYITPTDQDSETLKEFSYYREPFYRAQSQRLKELYQRKFVLVFGPDFYFHNPPVFNRALYVKRTLKTYLEANIPKVEILRALTLNPAKSLREENKVGVIKKGAYANLIGFKRNPLETFDVVFEEPMVINRGSFLK
nr:amidohydrolase family protein [Bacteriovorax sp. HI3]